MMADYNHHNYNMIYKAEIIDVCVCTHLSVRDHMLKYKVMYSSTNPSGHMSKIGKYK